MLKETIQRGRSERKVEAYFLPIRRDLERNENKAW
jgi:hypothetical protein